MTRNLRINRQQTLLAFILLITATSCSVGDAHNATFEQRRWTKDDLKDVTEKWIERSKVPGVVVGVSFPGRPDILIAAGESSIENNVAIKEYDQFRIASITKTFIAVEILKLAADRKLKLDDPLNAYLREIPHGDVVTIRDLLSHRSGYFDPVHDDPGFVASIARNLEKQWTWQDMLSLAFQHDLFFKPGSHYRYSNTNYILLGLVIEKVTRRPLGDVLTSEILNPLHLEHTLYTTPTTDTRKTDLVRGYLVHPLTGEIVSSDAIPYGTVISASVDNMISNASDLLVWSRSIYGRETRILPSDLKQKMLTFDDISPYGLGVFRFDTPIGSSLGHGGGTAGYLSLMEYYPAQDMSLVILANSDAPAIHLSELRDELLVVLFAIELDADVDGWIADLKSESVSTRKEAILALGQSGSKSDRAIQALLIVLKQDASVENRKEAALALGLVGKDSNLARQGLSDALHDPDAAVREAAGLALSVLNKRP